MDSQEKKRIVVAMSGGVDSSVACALLAKAGHEVIGITLRLWTPSVWNNNDKFGSCCSPREVSTAKKVCQDLNVPHYTYNMEKAFMEKVVDNFVSEYVNGRTPNPCVQCNRFIKFDPLFKYALALNADYLATGHYARIEKNADNLEFYLAKAKDLTKDQSYFLYMLGPSQLSRLLFPVGDFSKPEIRQMAEKFNLINAQKEDSQDVCFLEGRSYREFLKERVNENLMPKGPIVTRAGKVLGEHSGLANYTIGQRGGLGVAAGEPIYVIEKRTETNTLVVGAETENLKTNCKLHTVTWCSGNPPGQAVRAQVKVRYRHPGVWTTIYPAEKGLTALEFDEPQTSITPGQSAVFYDGSRVLGGGVIGNIS